MTAQLKSHSQGQTLVLTISNPEHRNALGPEMYSAGVETLNVAESNPDVRSVVITGEGAHFSAGGNLNRLLSNRDLPPEHQAQSIEGLHNWIEAIRTFPKPVISAVEGAAAGAGFSLALACDFLVAAQDSVFVMAYSSVGLSPDGGGSWHLGRALPRALVSQWLMRRRFAPLGFGEPTQPARRCFEPSTGLGRTADSTRTQRLGPHQRIAFCGPAARPVCPVAPGKKALRE